MCCGLNIRIAEENGTNALNACEEIRRVILYIGNLIMEIEREEDHLTADREKIDNILEKITEVLKDIDTPDSSVKDKVNGLLTKLQMIEDILQKTYDLFLMSLLKLLYILDDCRKLRFRVKEACTDWKINNTLKSLQKRLDSFLEYIGDDDVRKEADMLEIQRVYLEHFEVTLRS